MTAHDPRRAAFRPDLADVRLRGQVEAECFVAGRPARIAAGVADVLKAPRVDAGLNTQFLMGTRVTIFDEANGYAWVQSDRDTYVGYVALSDIGPAETIPTHRVLAPRSFVYSGPDLRLPRSGILSMGAEVEVVGQAETRGAAYAVLRSGGAVVASHIAPISSLADDYVAVAETLVNTPYLWGGTTGFGIDCSGLVQLALRMAGRDVLRDSDMQASELGEVLDPGHDFRALRRGDLVFWKGHVAIMTDAASMVHANGHTMLVSHEGLQEAIARIGYLYGEPTGFRRP